MPSPAGVNLDELADILRDFGSAAGNLPQQPGQLRQLYAQLDTLAAWAMGRVPPSLAARSDQLRDAALMFVQRACFAPDATHYQVLGLQPKTLTAATLRTRYRALIRLTHPDMGVQGLPVNAAGIVNRAHEVLSDPELRSSYDERLVEQRESAARAREQAPVRVSHIELQHGWAERWQSVLARYPKAASRALTLGGLGALGLGMFMWIASGPHESGTLIVARPASALIAAPAAAGPVSPAAALTVGKPPVPPTALVEVVSPPPPRTTAVADRGAGSSFPKWRPATASELDEMARPPERASLSSAAPSTTVAAPGTPAPAAATAGATETSTAQATALAVPDRPPPSTAINSATAASATPRGMVDAATAVKVAQMPAPPQPAPAMARNVPATSSLAPAPGSPWSVDASGAKLYLTELIGALERPAKARRTNADLQDMKVQGSLLQPALQLMRKYPDVNVELMTWTDSQRSGVMNVLGVVVMTVKAMDSEESRKVSFHLKAEFWGTREGTVLAALDLREGE